MLQRVLVQVDGPAGSGKTTLIEWLLKAKGWPITQCLRTQSAKGPLPVKSHPDLARYQSAGAVDCGLYRFSRPSLDDFFESDMLQDSYSQLVLMEGPRPIPQVDFAVFVAPSSAHPLLRKAPADPARRQQIDLANLTERLGSAKILEEVRQQLDTGRFPSTRRQEWVLSPIYEGIQRAQLVLVNIHQESERGQAEKLLEELTRLRKDPEVFQDVMGLLRNKLPITGVVANLSAPQDAGLKKAIARLKRAYQKEQ